jgi:sugar/nucleoside kinase (ribokinase family)
MEVRDDGIPIHLDFHNLTLGVNEKHERYRRPLETWRRWAFMLDTVQLNEEEFAGLEAASGTETQTVGHLLTLGVKGLLLTRGIRGVTAFCDEHKHTTRTDIPPSPLVEGVGTTGNGDMFGAAFLYHYGKSRNIPGAAAEAARAVAERLGKLRTEGL